MKIEHIKGPNDDGAYDYVAFVEPLTADDFTVVIEQPTLDGETLGGKYPKTVRGVIKVVLKDDIAEQLEALDLLPDEDMFFSLNKTRSWRKEYSTKWTYRGCRTEAQKAKRREEVIDEMREQLHAKRDTGVPLLIEDFVGRIEYRASRRSEEYAGYWRRVLTGQNLSPEWMAENLDLAGLDELKAKRDELEKQLRHANADICALKNRAMLAYLVAKDWRISGEEDGKGARLPKPLVEEIAGTLANNEGFASRRRGLF